MNGTGNLPAADTGKTLRIAAVADLHCRRDVRRVLRPMFEQIAGEADILLVCGDMTHFGLPDEAGVFLDEAVPVLGKIPVLAVLGNHDFESGMQNKLWHLFSDAGIIMFDGNSLEIRGVGFTGVRGFGGGFGNRSLHPWGEAVIKNFVKETVDEAGKLEAGLVRLAPGPRIVLLHYAPIRETVEGEPPELFPFLGSSRLEESLDRFTVTAVFHGHAHHGKYRGRTTAGTPVYNVAAAVLKQQFPAKPPFLLVEVPLNDRTVP